ncbi:YCF48-related protein [Emticicia sp. SJ17W-69]|uniref:WD40/YVTN/BNR-like repeat-containing protein n=1 Tax=Emticicia sp. SJ17W-69 TaxID=3421657 RepID=UPI003EBCE75C
MKKIYCSLLFLLLLVDLNAQFRLSANQSILCNGNSTTITLLHPNANTNFNATLQRNGVNIASTTTGEHSYTTSEAGEYQYVYDDRPVLRQIFGPKLDVLTAYNDIYFINPTTGFIVGENGVILKTTNGGQDWGLISNTNSSYLNGYRSISFSDANNGWVLSSWGKVLKTTDGGNTWTDKSLAPIWVKDISAVSATTAWVVGREYRPIIKKTSNGGDSWEDVSIGTLNSDRYLNTVFFLNQNIGFIAGDRGIIYKTINGGTNWQSISISSNTYLDFTDIFFLDANTGWCITVGGIIFKTTDGGTNWTMQAQGNGNDYSETNNKIHFFDTMNGVASRGELIQKTADGGQTWTYFGPIEGSSGSTNSSALYFFSPDNGFKTTADRIYKYYSSMPRRTNSVTIEQQPIISSENPNICLNQITTLSVNNTSSYSNIQWLKENTPITNANQRNYSPSETGNYQVRSSTSIDSWQIKPNLPGTEYFSFANAQIGWIRGANANHEAVFFKTIDGGETFSETVVPSAETQLRGLTKFTVRTTQEAWAIGYEPFIGYSYYIKKTTDGGVTWTKKKSETGDKVLRDIFFLDENRGWAVGSTFGGNYEAFILRTTDGGENWVTQSSYHPFINNLSNIFFTNANIGWAWGIDSEFHQSNSNSIILKTTDGGNNWTKVLSVLGENPKAFFLDENNGWFSTRYYMYRTHDGGANWTMLPSQYKEVFGQMYFSNLNDGIMLFDRANFSGPADYDAGTYRTNDGGNTWRKLTAIQLSDVPAQILGLNKIFARIGNTMSYLTQSTFSCQSLPITVGTNCCSLSVNLSSPNDDITNGIITKQASATNGNISASNQISGLAKVTYQAKSIQLNPNFKADNGTVFKAEIGGCN